MPDPWKRVPIRRDPPEMRIRHFREYIHPYTREEAIEEAQRCLRCPTHPCIQACPAGVKARFYIEAIADGDFDRALSIVREDLPVSSICGRVCPHPCESACVRGKRGDPLAIRWLKRAAEDYGQVQEIPEGTDRPKRLAVIGAGPAGLSVAYFIASKGHHVEVFEDLPKPGGMAYVGIPRFRLSEDAIMKDVKRVQDLDVEIHYSIRIGRDLTIDDLFDRGFDAIFIGIGAHIPYRLRCEGEGLEGVYQAVTFLKDLALGRAVKIGRRVGVVGGGNVAMDAARTALRLGADEVHIIYRRSWEQMPADEEEIEETKEEGIRFHLLQTPVKVHGDGRMTAVECIKMELGEPDDSGRRRPIPIEGSEFIFELDMLIPAISQKPDTDWIVGIERTRWGTLVVDEETCMTSKKGVFAGGDAVLGPRTVIDAVATAKRASKAILEYFDAL